MILIAARQRRQTLGLYLQNFDLHASKLGKIERFLDDNYDKNIGFIKFKGREKLNCLIFCQFRQQFPPRAAKSFRKFRNCHKNDFFSRSATQLKFPWEILDVSKFIKNCVTRLAVILF